MYMMMIRASQVCKAGRCIGLFLQGCIGQGMVMVWSWYVYPRRVERYVHPYIITTYTHTCVYVITSISPGNASHVNILCTCTPLYTLSERYTCISYRSRLADIPLLCVAVCVGCGYWINCRWNNFQLLMLRSPTNLRREPTGYSAQIN